MYSAVELFFSGIARILVGITRLVKIYGWNAPVVRDIESGCDILNGPEASISQDVCELYADV